MSDQSHRTGPRSSSWGNIIKLVDTPLRIFALFSLIASMILASIVRQASASDSSFLIRSMTVLIFVLVAAVVYLANRGNNSSPKENDARTSSLPSLPSSSGTDLRNRSELPSLHEQGRDASEIVLVGISLISLIAPYTHYLEERLRAGCKLRILMVNPESDCLQAWEQTSRFPSAQADIQRSLANMGNVLKVQAQSAGRNCEIRLMEALPPFSAVAVDPQSNAGWTLIEYHTYKTTLGERPHVLLRAEESPQWFQFYRAQCQALWDDAKPWTSHAT